MKAFPFLCLLAVCWLPAPSIQAQSAPPKKETQTLVVGAGCFWCAEALFEEQPGVLNAVSGYTGGTVKDPTYEQVSGGGTGHVEVVRIEFDPAVTRLEHLLDFFWKIHDPTDPRGVWPDFGPQYRSSLYYRDEAQHKAMLASLDRAQKKFAKSIATLVLPLGDFYEAEGYHQDYAKENPGNAYIERVLKPKLEKHKK